MASNQVGAKYIARDKDWNDYTLDIAFGLKPDYVPGKVINRTALARAIRAVIEKE